MAKKQAEEPEFGKASDILSKSFGAVDSKATGSDTDVIDTDDDTDDNDYDNLFPPGHPMYRETAQDDDDDDADDKDDQDDDEDVDDKKKGKVANKDNPKRFEYWQSQATKLQEMNQKLLERMDENLDKQQPAGPKIVTIVDEIASTEQELKAIVVPAKPTKPSDFDEMEAYNDPDSASFKYRKKLSDWQEEKMEAMDKRDTLRDKLYDLKVKNVEEPMRRMAHKTQLSEQQQKLVANVQKDYKFTQEQAIEFIEDMSKPESVSLDNLVALFKIKKGLVSPASNDKPSGGNRFQQRKAAPPIPNGSGASKDGDDDDDLELTKDFNKGLLSFQ